MSIGSRIKELRESKNISRPAFAKKIGVTVGAISNYENGVSSPKEPILYKIIEHLECDANYLFQDNVKMKDMTNRVSPCDLKLLNQYHSLDGHGQRLVKTVLESECSRAAVASFPQADLSAAHERTDVEVTDDMRKNDDDIMDGDDF